MNCRIFYSLLILLNISTATWAQSLADYPWLDDVLDTENCCENKTVTEFDLGNYAFIYIAPDDTCIEAYGKLYFEDGQCWCTESTSLDCLTSYGLDASKGTNLFTCTGESSYDVFEAYPWLSSFVNPTTQEVQLIDLGVYSFLYVMDCASETGTLYFETGELYCTDATNYNCLEAYGFMASNITITSTCEDEGGGGDPSCTTSIWYEDADGDGLGNSDVSQEACDQPDGFVADNTDDDDSCNGVVDACLVCNGTGPATWYEDADGDGLGNPAVSQEACDQPTGYVSNAEDLDDSGTAASVSYPLNATGQITIYDNDGAVISGLSTEDALYGQDAHFLKGNTMSFQDNGDGTVTDLNTGLMWQMVPSSQTFTWQEGVDHCENLELAGYDDWRIPNLKELYSISDFGTGWPYLNTNFFTLASGQINKDEQYWSSNYYVGIKEDADSEAAFGVNHVTGHIKAYIPDATGPVGGKFVRAVRGNTYGTNDFTVNGDETITDNATGLMWMQNDNGEGLDWEDALQYAANAEIAGYSDWRLPNVKELQSIVDYSYAPNAPDPSQVGPAINPIFSCTPIVNEAGNDDYAYYWTSTSSNFTSGEPYYYAWYVAFGRAVEGTGLDSHGAGGVRFDTKYEGGPLGEGGERYYNYIRLVRDK